MAKKVRDNRVKRKRGKKFVYDGDETTANRMEKEARATSSNPFE